MRISLVLLLVGALVGSARPAHADSPDPCESWAAEQALPYLLQAYSYTPYGTAGLGWAPQFQTPATPFGPGPIGPATLFGPPGLAPVYGPAGPAGPVPGLGGTMASFGNATIAALNAPPAAGNVAMVVAQAAAGADAGLILPPFLPGGLVNLAGPTLNGNGGGVSAGPAGTAAAVRQLLTFDVALTRGQAVQSQFYALNQRYLASAHAQTAVAAQRLGAAQAAQNTFDDAKAACQAHLAEAAAGGSGASPPAAPSQP